MNPAGLTTLAIRSTKGVNILQGHNRTKENNTLVSDTSGMFLKECHPTAGVEKSSNTKMPSGCCGGHGGWIKCRGSAKIFINHPIYPLGTIFKVLFRMKWFTIKTTADRPWNTTVEVGKENDIFKWEYLHKISYN